MPFAKILQQKTLIEGCFHSVFGVDLETVWRVKSWRWFVARIMFLLQTDTPLNRYFTSDQQSEVPDE